MTDIVHTIAQSLIYITLISGSILLIVTITAAIVLRTIVSRGKSVVQVIWGQQERGKHQKPL